MPTSICKNAYVDDGFIVPTAYHNPAEHPIFSHCTALLFAINEVSRLEEFSEEKERVNDRKWFLNRSVRLGRFPGKFRIWFLGQSVSIEVVEPDLTHIVSVLGRNRNRNTEHPMFRVCTITLEHIIQRYFVLSSYTYLSQLFIALLSMESPLFIYLVPSVQRYQNLLSHLWERITVTRRALVGS